MTGRQRYETLLKFYNNEIKLDECGLEKNKDLDGLNYEELPRNLKELFRDYRMKVMKYQIDDTSSITEEDLEILKRDLFRRYNFGMTALEKSEVARAKYFFDSVTNMLIDLFNSDNKFYNQCIEILLPPTKREINDRERMNVLLVNIREVLVTPYIPIIDEKTIKMGSSMIDKYYFEFIIKLNDKQKEDKINEFFKIANTLYSIKKQISQLNSLLSDNILFFKSAYWMLSILYNEYPNSFYRFNINKFCNYVEINGQNYFDNFKNITSEHIESRHAYMKNYIVNELNLNITNYLEKIKENRKIVNYKKKIKLNKDEDYEIGADSQLITSNETIEMSELIKKVERGKLIIRSNYQRGEIKNKIKASRIIESIILGAKLPPIYLYTEIGKNGIGKDMVLDRTAKVNSNFSVYGKEHNNRRWQRRKSI